MSTMTTASVTLPQPVKSGWTWNWMGKKNRSLSAFFPLAEKVETERGWTQKGVEVSVHHNGDRKNFLARVYATTKGRDGVFETSSYSLMDGVTLAQTSVARYSDKALEAEFERVLAAFPAFVETTTKVAEMFEGKHGADS